MRRTGWRVGSRGGTRSGQMPFRSQAQMRAAFGGYLGPAMQAKAKTWAAETPDVKRLPGHVSRKAALVKKLRGER